MADDHRVPVDLPRVARKAELGEVGDPELVRTRGAEGVGAVVPQGQVGRGGRHLADVGAVPAPPPAPRHEAVLAHDAADELLGDPGPGAAQLGVDGAVPAVAAPIERPGDEGPEPRERVGRPRVGPVVVPGAAGYLKETDNLGRRQTGRPPQSLSELAPAPHRGRKGVRAFPF